MHVRVSVLLSLLSFIFLGCGTPGAPRPPSLQLPKPVEDLRAVRVGDKVYLQWSVPTETSDGEGLKRLGATRVCRAYPAAATSECGNEVAKVTADSAKDGKMTAVDDLSSALANSTTDFLNYNVQVLNDRGKSAGPSNAATVFLAPSAPMVRDVSAVANAEGVTLSWTAEAPRQSRLRSAHQLRIERASAGAAESATIATVPYETGTATYVDKNAEWEKPYQYRVIPVTQVLSLDGRLLSEFTGEPSQAITITPRDTFAPKAPSGVQAVFSGIAAQASIDLTWIPNEESDIAGYNVYRQEGSAAAVKVNTSLVQTPAFRDARVRAGSEYSYLVTAVDARGNESPKSEPAKESVPQN